MTAKIIAFLSSSFEYTEGFFPLANRLQDSGYEVNWICFRGYEKKWLLERGVPQENILDTLGNFQVDVLSEDYEARLLSLENSKQPYIKHLISMDRLLRLKDENLCHAYLANIEVEVSQFLTARGVSLVTGGRDTALQIAVSKICDKLSINYIVPTACRIPDDRYGFCRGYKEEAFIILRNPDEGDRNCAVQYLENFRVKRPPPLTVEFERRNNQFFRRIPGDIGLIVRMAYRGMFDRGNDFTRYSMKSLLGMYFRRRWNWVCTKIAPPFQKQGGRPFVLYAYQMQPESSIDVLASQYSDQTTLIRQIACSIPFGYDFYVKPHPDHVGGLSRKKLVEISRIPGVTLVDPFLNGRELMYRASLVITPAGTMAYEAALSHIPSIIFSNEFYGILPSVHQCRSIEDLPQLITDLLNSPVTSDDKPIIEFLAHLFANTFHGRNTSYFGGFTENELGVMGEAYDQIWGALTSHSFRVTSAA